MTKISNQYSLTNILTADLANSRLGINNVSPAYSLDVTGTARISGISTFTTSSASTSIFNSTDTNGGYITFQRSGTAYGYIGSAYHLLTPVGANTDLAVSTNGSFIIGTGASLIPRMTITSAGNVGIGLTSILAKLHVENTSSADPTSLSSVPTTNIFGMSTSPGGMLAAGIGTTGGTHVWLQGRNVGGAGVSYPIVFQPLGGNVGIGTTSPGGRLEVAGADTTIRLRDSNGGVTDFGNDSVGTYWRDFSNNTFRWLSSAGTERMRITNGGSVLINRTATGGQNARVQVSSSGTDGYFIEQISSGGFCNASIAINNGGTYYFNYFQAGATGVGSITSNGSTTSYNVTSDYRLKEDLRETKGLEKASAIKVYDYKYKSSNMRMDGVLAHELQEVIPYAVTGEKDGEYMQGVDYSKIVPVLVKAIQELSAKVSLLENK